MAEITAGSKVAIAQQGGEDESEGTRWAAELDNQLRYHAPTFYRRCIALIESKMTTVPLAPPLGLLGYVLQAANPSQAPRRNAPRAMA